MLGRFGKGMTVRVPVRFRSQDQAVDVDNVILAIEYFNNDAKQVVRLLDDTPMQKVSIGEYGFDYVIPQTIGIGNYIVRIKAKQPGSKSGILETTDHFEVVDSSDLPVTMSIKADEPKPTGENTLPPVSNQPPAQAQMLTLANSPNIMKGNSRTTAVEDVIVDAYNNPVANAHVNVFDKNTFIPRSVNNVKVATAMTNPDGKFTVHLLPGEYIFSYKGINLREAREIKKVQ